MRKRVGGWGVADNSPKSHNSKEGGRQPSRVAMKRSKFWRILFSRGSPRCRRVSSVCTAKGEGWGERGNAEAVQDVAGALFLGEEKKMVKGNFAHYF